MGAARAMGNHWWLIRAAMRGNRRVDMSNRNGAAGPIGESMKRVTGIGGIFFNAKDPAALNAW